jgi:hypothetical protein
MRAEWYKMCLRVGSSVFGLVNITVHLRIRPSERLSAF